MVDAAASDVAPDEVPSAAVVLTPGSVVPEFVSGALCSMCGLFEMPALFGEIEPEPGGGADVATVAGMTAAGAGCAMGEATAGWAAGIGGGAGATSVTTGAAASAFERALTAPELG